MSILIVGEKPSVSRAISAVVGASSAHKGYTKGNGYIVSWCVGHLVGLKYPRQLAVPCHGQHKSSVRSSEKPYE